MPNSPVTRIFSVSYLYDALLFAIESSLKEFRSLFEGRLINSIL